MSSEYAPEARRVPRAADSGCVTVGTAPPLAGGLSLRPDTGPGPGLLPPGQNLALAPPDGPLQRSPDWPGGTGTTQCAAHLAASLWEKGQVELVIWIEAVSRAAVLAGYAQASAATAHRAPVGDIEAIASRFVASLETSARPWLVVLDGVDRSGDLRGLWPAGPAGRVLVTLRDPGLLPHARYARVFPVGAFSPHEALTYLLGRLSADPDQRLGAVDLLEEVGGEPLALAQASATIASSSLTCRDYRDLFVQRRDEMAEKGGAPHTAAVTWALAVDQAKRLHPGGAVTACLALASLLGCQAIPETVFTAPAAREFILGDAGAGAAGPERARMAVLALERVGLLAAGAGEAPTVWVHPAVQAAARAAMPDATRQQAARAAAKALLQAWPAEETQPWQAQPFRACVSSVERAAGDALWLDDSHMVLFQAGNSLDAARLTGPAAAHWRALAMESERHLGPGHPETQRASERLARACLAAGAGEEAVRIFQRAFDIRSGALGPRHPSTITARADLGLALLAAGDVAGAVAALEHALADSAGARPPAGLDTLAVQAALAEAYLAAGRARDSARLGGLVLAERERAEGPDHPVTVATRAKLAAACLAAGQSRDAIAHGKRALADADRVLGRDHPDTLAALTTLASACHAARRMKDAIQLHERALADRERLQGPDHPDTLAARGNLASAYHSAGRVASAMPLYERTRADCQRVLGPRHPDTLAARANLAHAYYAVGRIQDALTLLRGTLEDCERALPAGDPLTAAVRDSLRAASDA